MADERSIHMLGPVGRIKVRFVTKMGNTMLWRMTEKKAHHIMAVTPSVVAAAHKRGLPTAGSEFVAAMMAPDGSVTNSCPMAHIQIPDSMGNHSNRLTMDARWFKRSKKIDRELDDVQ